MRPLIRPTLFAFARLGLFLAVTAWAVGLWQTIHILIPVPVGTAGLELSSGDWKCRFIDRKLSVQWSRLVCTADSPSATMVVHEVFLLTSSVLHDPSIGSRSGPVRFSHSEAAFSPVNQPVKDFRQLPHYLIVTAFALFYAVLKWVYRKRRGQSDQTGGGGSTDSK